MSVGVHVHQDFCFATPVQRVDTGVHVHACDEVAITVAVQVCHLKGEYLPDERDVAIAPLSLSIHSDHMGIVVRRFDFRFQTPSRLSSLSGWRIRSVGYAAGPHPFLSS